MPLSRKATFITLVCLPASACGVQGPPDQNLSSLPAIDMHADLGKIDGSAVLGAPAGWLPAPTLPTPTFRVAAPQLLMAIRDILLAKPRTWIMSEHPDVQQDSFIVRSAFLNLPDVVVVQAMPVDGATSKVVILSRSRYDAVPFIAVNKGRVSSLIQELTERFGTTPNPTAPASTGVTAAPKA